MAISSTQRHNFKSKPINRRLLEQAFKDNDTCCLS